MAKNKKQDELEQRLDELTLDLQRTRADFENYRKRTEADRAAVYQHGQSAAILKLLPIIDNIERAIVHTPEDLKDNKWAQGIAGLTKNLEKSLEGLNLKRIDASESASFDPHLHEAISTEEGEGENQVIAEELQAGYTLNGTVIRHSLVRVKHI